MRLIVAVLLLAACASQPAPTTQSQSILTDACDPAITSAGLAGGSGDVQPAKVIRRVEPEVSPFQGTHIIEIEAIIDEMGRVSSICSVKGDPELAASTINALRQWVFEPGTLNGKPVKVRFHLTNQYKN